MSGEKAMQAAKEGDCPKSTQSEVKCVALGEDVEMEIVEVNDNGDRPLTVEDRVIALEERLVHAVNMLDNLFTMVKEIRDKVDKESDTKIKETIEKKKSDFVIPEGTVLNGTTKGMSYFLQVRDGAFYVGSTRYESLSSAAEGVSGVRRSGWTFWKLPDGKTVKEVFRR